MLNHKRFAFGCIVILSLSLMCSVLLNRNFLTTHLVLKHSHSDLINSARIKTHKDKECLKSHHAISNFQKYTSNIRSDSVKPMNNISNSRYATRGIISVSKTQLKLTQERDLLHLVLTTRDSLGNQRIQGGDFFYATLSDSKKERWTAGKAIDYDNGTYSVYFYVGWEGSVYINVTLVNPREDVLWTKNVYRPSEGKPKLMGMFRKSEKEGKGNGICTIRREGTWENKCEYKNENSLGKSVILCEKPQDFNCNDLIFFTGNTKRFLNTNTTSISSNTSHYVKNNIKDMRTFQIQQNKKQIYMVPIVKQYVAHLNKSSRLNQTASNIDTNLNAGTVICLPKCGPGLPEPVSDGYWANSTWNSLVCNSKHWTNQTEILLCLKDKNIYFIGDSTLRQWYERLVKLVGYTENKKEIRDKLHRHYINKLYNFNATFYFHFWYGTVRIYPVEKSKFMADIVDSLSDPTCNYIVFITASFHFPAWTRESYGEMLEKTKEAVDRLLERCPNSIVVVKGSHPRGDRDQNWIYHDMNLHLRQIFAKDPRIIFIDVWDMDLSFPYSMSVHMPELVISQELFLVFSHMCS